MKPYVPTMLCSYLLEAQGALPRSRAAARGPLHQAFQFQPPVPAGARNQCSGGDVQPRLCQGFLTAEELYTCESVILILTC